MSGDQVNYSKISKSSSPYRRVDINDLISRVRDDEKKLIQKLHTLKSQFEEQQEKNRISITIICAQCTQPYIHNKIYKKN